MRHLLQHHYAALTSACLVLCIALEQSNAFDCSSSSSSLTTTAGSIRRTSTTTNRRRRRSSALQLPLLASPTPIDPAGWPLKFPAQEHCSKCGLCETRFVSKVVDACAFLERTGMSRMDKQEVQVHGRQRNADSMVWSSSTSSSTGSSTDTTENNQNGFAEEARFGVLHQPVQLAQGVNIGQAAQWTGVVTGIARSMLESGQVDAVVCIANNISDNDSDNSNNNWSSPEPILARTVDDVLRGRGVKPALAPSLRVLDEIQNDETIQRLLFCGVGCAVQAFRAVEKDLNLEKVYVLGTNCADNSPTATAAEIFLRDGVKVDTANKEIRGYEFMQDFQVHVKTADEYIKRPYFSLPGTIAEQSIAKSCLACFDYTNGLADVVVGYMGAPLVSGSRMDESFQTLTVRNERGAHMVETAVDAGLLRLGDVATGQGKHESLSAATVQGDTLVMAMTGKPLRKSGMPVWLGKILAFVISNTGPKGINFARYSIDYHVLRNYLHLVDEGGEERALNSMPQYAKDIVEHYRESEPTFETVRSEVVAGGR